VQALLRSLAPIIGAEEKLGGKAISEGWADVDEKKLEEWSMAGQESALHETKQIWDDAYDEEYARLFRAVSAYRLLLCDDVPLTPVSASGIAKEP
jgi:hypothetical protein